jgi:hypothetical protein
MAKTTKVAASKTKASDPEREGNRYVRAARVLAKDDKIDVATLADRAFMSESTAARCLEAWNAVIGALIEVGRLPDPAKAAQKKAPPKTPKAQPAAAAGTTQPIESGTVVDTGVVTIS